MGHRAKELHCVRTGHLMAGVGPVGIINTLHTVRERNSASTGVSKRPNNAVIYNSANIDPVPVPTDRAMIVLSKSLLGVGPTRHGCTKYSRILHACMAGGFMPPEMHEVTTACPSLHCVGKGEGVARGRFLEETVTTLGPCVSAAQQRRAIRSMGQCSVHSAECAPSLLGHWHSVEFLAWTPNKSAQEHFETQKPIHVAKTDCKLKSAPKMPFFFF